MTAPKHLRVGLPVGEFGKATASGPQGNCVEAGLFGETVVVRNSKHPDGLRLLFSKAEWSAFLAGAQGGEFDL